MNTFFKTLMVGAVAIAAVACTDEPQVITPEKDAVQDIFVNADGSETSVSRADVDAVVGKMFEKQNKSRSTSYTVSSINDNDGNPTIYVINYANNEGFLLLSATKTHSPILAYANEGNFVGDPFGKTGLSLWQDDMIADIKLSTNLPKDSIIKVQREWDYYTSTQKKISFVKSRLDESDPYYQDYRNALQILQDSVVSWINNGYQIYNITDQFLDNNAQCEQIRTELQGYIYLPYQESWEDLTIVRAKDRSISGGTGNFVHSKWNQINDYNQAYPYISGTQQRAYAGCGPVAMGQIMRYYQHPIQYNWQQMPLESATLTTSQFLYDIAEECDASYDIDGTTVYVSDMENAFKQFDYNVTLGNANWNTIKSEVNSYRPVCMTGYNNVQDVGHAWVISGYSYFIQEHTVEVFSFPMKDEMGLYYINTDPRSSSGSFYTNWGWGGYSDGFYAQSYLTTSTDRYPNSQKMFTNIRPKY